MKRMEATSFLQKHKRRWERALSNGRAAVCGRRRV